MHLFIYFFCICFASCQWIIDSARHFTDCYCLDKMISSALLTFINSNFVIIDESGQRFSFYQEARREKLHVKEKTLDIFGCASPLWSLFCFGDIWDFYDKRYLNTLVSHLHAPICARYLTSAGLENQHSECFTLPNASLKKTSSPWKCGWPSCLQTHRDVHIEHTFKSPMRLTAHFQRTCDAIPCIFV